MFGNGRQCALTFLACRILYQGFLSALFSQAGGFFHLGRQDCSHGFFWRSEEASLDDRHICLGPCSLSLAVGIHLLNRSGEEGSDCVESKCLHVEVGSESGDGSLQEESDFEDDLPERRRHHQARICLLRGRRERTDRVPVTCFEKSVSCQIRVNADRAMSAWF